MGIGTPEEIAADAAAFDLPHVIPDETPVDDLEMPSPLETGEGIPEPLGFMERFKLGAEIAAPTYNWITGLAKTPYEPEPDPLFRHEDNLDLYEGISVDDRDHLFDAVSREDLEVRRNEILNEQAQAQRLMKDGALSGMALMIAPAVLDPTFWGAMSIEGVGALNLATKSQRMWRMGLMAGTAATLEMGALAVQKATVDAEDVVYAGLAGLTLGAGIGKLIAPADDAVRAADKATDTFAKSAMKDMDTELVNPTRRDMGNPNSVFRSHDPDAAAELAAARTADEAVAGVDETIPPGYGESLTAARKEAEAAGEFKPGLITGSKTFKVLSKNPLMSDFLQLFKTKSKDLQYLAMHLLENASGVGGREVTASILALGGERKYLKQVMPFIRSSYRTYTKENGIRIWSKKYWTTAAEDHNRVLRLELEQYGNASRKGTEYISEQPKHIQEAVNAWRKTMKDMAEHARVNGVRGFDDLVPYDGYVPLLWTGAKMMNMTKKGKEGFLKVTTKGYMQAGINEKDARRIAKAVFARKSAQALGIDSNPGALLAKDSRVYLREMLEANDVPDGEIQSLFGRLDLAQAKQGESARAKSRVPIDLTVEVDGVKLLDYVNNDMASLGSRYIVEMAGRSALAAKGIRHDGAWRAIKNSIMAEVGELGEDTAKISKILDSTYAQFLGQPVGEGVNRNARRLMEWAMTSMLGTVGAAQLAESPNVIAAHGMANLLRYSPDLRRFRRAVRRGEVDDSLLSELDAHLGGLWDEHLFFRPEVRLDQSYGADSGIFQALDNVLAGSREMVGYASGMNYVKNVQQQFVAIGQANKVMKFLKKGGSDEKILTRFRDVGWDEGSLSRFKKYIDDGTVTWQKNGAVDKLNLEKWDDADIETFSIGMNRHSMQLIQFPAIGETNTWQHGTIGAMMTQFRSFPLLAIEKQTARNIIMPDTEAFTAFSGSLGLSGLIYMAKVHATSLGRPDREEYLEKRMNPIAVANGALQWAGMFSIGSEVVNLASSVGLINPDYGSGSVGRAGTGAFSFDSNVPSLAVARSGLRFTSDILNTISPFSDKRWGNSETDNAFKALPTGNILPHIILRNLLHNIPEEE